MEEKKLVYGNWNDNSSDFEWEQLNQRTKRFAIPGTDCTIVLNVIDTSLPGTNQPRPTHSHVYEQFMIFVEGEGVAEVDGISYPITDGSFIVVPPGAQHKFDTAKTSKKVINFDVFTPARNEYIKRKQK
ncbi:MAG: cupin domain-containing protein [Eubacteriales bacterium]